MTAEMPERFRTALLARAGGSHADALKSASLNASLGGWTTALTACVVNACHDLGWRASAKAHPCDLLPVSRHEYLSLDVMAFPPGAARWIFPAAALELENSPREDVIAYSLWKVLAVRAGMRVVFCYRRNAEAGPELIRHLRREVVGAMDLAGRVALEGRTFVVVGSRNDADTFPYGFFRWWELNTHTGRFDPF